jgi:TRAP-type mannitol/chloroaromatic compound transport system permease small subunit
LKGEVTLKLLRAIIGSIDAVNEVIGKGASWLVLFLMLITFYDVLMRYVFRAGTVALMEAETNLYVLNFILAAGWTMINDGHVRVDLLYANFGTKKKAWINLIGSLVFCIPFCILVIWASLPFVFDSWALKEGSPDPGGLPCVYLMKTAMPVAFVLLGLQAIAQATKSLFVIVGKEKQL